MATILLEARPYRPFKSSEEYLEAMKEDLAEWLNTMYPELLINADNFMDRLDTGVALCKHANYVRQAAEDYLARRQARNKSMTRSMTSGLAGPILAMGNVHYLPAAKSGTFFSRDNVSNFITWCRKSLKIIECLLFETDDLIMRKNEKHVILCLLEVARRGAKFGMLAPMLVQMERQIDREIAADNKANGIGCGTQTESGIGIETSNTDNEDEDDDEDEEDDGPMMFYGPQPQIVTNDLKSLDEMVRDLVEKCTCPSQFPMVRVSEGKYRIGDTKVLIFVRILRSHVMVRVGGGWDTLSHYLDKHDPCRCKAQHRSSVAARLIPPRSTNQSNGIELHRAQVIFERSPPTARKIISSFNNSPTGQHHQHQHHSNHHSHPHHHSSSAGVTSSPSNGCGANSSTSTLSPNYNGGKNRSRSPTPQRKYLNQLNNNNNNNNNSNNTTTNAAPTSDDKQHLMNGQGPSSSPNLSRRSMSPSPRRLIDIRKKQTSFDSNNGPKSLPNGNELIAAAVNGSNNTINGTNGSNHVQFDAMNLIHSESNGKLMEIGTPPNGGSGVGGGGENSSSTKFENISDNGSEISDEGYRSLGVIQSNAQKRESLHSQTSIDDAESNARHDQTSSDSQLSPVDDRTLSTKTREISEAIYCNDEERRNITTTNTTTTTSTTITAAEISNDENIVGNKFEQSGIFITEDEITVDIASATGLRKTGFSAKILGGGDDVDHSTAAIYPIEIKSTAKKSRSVSKESNKVAMPAQQTIPVQGVKSKIPRSPLPQRRRSVDNSSCTSINSLGQSTEVHNRTGLPVFNRKKPVYRSVRKPQQTESTKPPPASSASATNTWSGGRVPASGKRRPSITADTFNQSSGSGGGGCGNGGSTGTSPSSSAFDRHVKTRSSQILYDSNGRRIKGCTASLTTSPVKNHAASPLAQQLLEAASNAKNDAQILEKMKTLLSRYSTTNCSPTAAAAATAATGVKVTVTDNRPSQSAVNKKPIYDDFTTAWVNSNGNLERSSSCSPPAVKVISKRSSAASSTESTHSRDISSVHISPRRDRGMSKIPAPRRQNTELY